MSAQGEANGAARRRGSSVGRGIGFGCLALLAAPFLLVAGVIGAYLIARAVPEDYPEAEPEAVARRITGTSADVTRALRLGGPDTDGWGRQWTRSGPGVDVGPAPCHADGLENWLEEPVPGAFFLAHRWQVEHVSEAEAESALRRAAAYLRRHGWRITEFSHEKAHRYLNAERNGDEVDLTWTATDPGAGPLEGRTYSPCTYDPTPQEGLPAL
ncbi:hypothetical protein ITI46_19120 [Streptomyces oryzae]|uniref:Uncharacterized protein n=1 Tax=Streptomyces oryzae TaxID=1434886 RepID=A0ABS3XEC6_9ACTN|nr:hypothetical protein [Streptomyces oryzae]MBO8193755.1 hypothetical protein [Streptomyces oryzae]